MNDVSLMHTVVIRSEKKSFPEFREQLFPGGIDPLDWP